MKHKDLGCSDTVKSCEGCGHEFRPDDEVRVEREYNAVICDDNVCLDLFCKNQENARYHVLPSRNELHGLWQAAKTGMERLADVKDPTEQEKKAHENMRGRFMVLSEILGYDDNFPKDSKPAPEQKDGMKTALIEEHHETVLRNMVTCPYCGIIGYCQVPDYVRVVECSNCNKEYRVVNPESHWDKV